jgi:beta-lactamase superfamily II metal-dependent hydrolase
MPESNPISVRMYRQGLGDCFLLTIPAARGEFHMLIDCGVVLGTSDPATRMGEVLDDILKATDGRIDLLVVTHEHWDHVSGFTQARDRFDKLEIARVWVAWTEDPADPLARKLRAERRTAENALRMAAAHLAVAGDTETAERVASLVSFFGAASGSTEDALAYAKGRGPGGKPRYCQPGEPAIVLPELPGIRFWILGPPKDETLIKKSNPSAGTAYGLDAGPGGSQSPLIAGLTRGFAAAAGAGTSSDDPLGDPFDPIYAIPLARAEHVPFFEQRYFGELTDGSLFERSARQEIRDQSWRRIDAQWMGASETMALQLDSATNNTSLVLAIEKFATGEVLLFPGDAQAGNWLSWQDLKWDGVTGPDLLARTVLYKVGHHGSHNATLKAKGLELMVNDALMAMIPVDHAMAVKKHWDRMPLPELVERIEEKTHGRVLRIDDKVTSAADLDGLKPDTVSATDWKQFTKRVRVSDLYYEITV